MLLSQYTGGTPVGMSRVDAMDDETRGYFDEIRRHLVTLDGKVTGLDGKVTTLDGKVTTLDGKVTPLDGKVAALDRRSTAELEDWTQSSTRGFRRARGSSIGSKSTCSPPSTPSR